MNASFGQGNRAARRAADKLAQRAARRDRRRRRRAIATGAALLASATTVGLASPAAADHTDGMVVNTLVDPELDDVVLGDGVVSLREALSNTLVNHGEPDVITFSSSLSGTIELKQPLTIPASVDIQGPGADVLTVAAPLYVDGYTPTWNPSYEYFALSMDGGSAHGKTVSISGMTITGSYDTVLLAEDVDLTLDDVTISDGNAFAGGGVNATGTGSLTIENSTISGNAANVRGAGVFAGPDQTVSVSGSEISANVSQGHGGGIFSEGDLTVAESVIEDNTAGLGSGRGGGISVGYLGGNPSLTVTESTITGNAARQGGGGIDANTTADVVIEDSSITSNHASRFTVISPGTLDASARGGGIRLQGNAELTIRSSAIDDNDNATWGAGIAGVGSGTGPTLVVEDSSISGNTGTGIGGGVYFDTDAGAVTISDSTIDANTAASSGGGLMVRGDDPGTIVTGSTVSDNVAEHDGGGGVYAEGSLSIDGSTISGNTVADDDGHGGGIEHSGQGALSISSSTVSGNTAGSGGGIYAETNDATIVNSTISGNDATYAYGGDPEYADHYNDTYGGGGAVRVVGGSLDVISSTITGNDAAGGTDGIHTFGYDGSIVTLQSTILAGNGTVDLGMATYDGGDIGTATASYSLIGATAIDVAGEHNLAEVEDPELGALADNGGPTRTHLPLPGSPVIDAGGPSDLDRDQRGFTPRVIGAASDIGSVEVGATSPTTTTTVPPTTTTTVPPTTTTTTSVPPATTTTTTTEAPRRSSTTTTTATTTPATEPVVVQREVSSQGTSDLEVETSAGTVLISVRGAAPGADITVTVREVSVEDAGVDTRGFEIDGKIYEVEIDGSDTSGATVCFPYSGADSPTIVHWRDDGTREVLNTTVVSGNACADTGSFSPFAVVFLATERIAGADAAETAAAVSAATFEPGVPVAYVAARTDVTDAVVAAAAGAPLLLVDRDAIPAATAAELDRLDADRIVVVGGTSVVTDAVVSSLGASRVAGADRFQTAAAVALDRFPSGVPTVYLANGSSAPDALVAASVAGRERGAVLFVERDAVPAATMMALAALGPDRVVVVGGTSVVSDAVVSTMAATRVAGADRYATAAAMAGDGDDVVVARGDHVVDAVVGASLGRPLLLVLPSAVPEATEQALARLTPRAINVLGGTAAISAQTEADVAAHMSE